MDKRQINMCPASSVIRKQLVKITMKCHYMSIRMAKKKKKMTVSSVGEDAEG